MQAKMNIGGLGKTKTKPDSGVPEFKTQHIFGVMVHIWKDKIQLFPRTENFIDLDENLYNEMTIYRDENNIIQSLILSTQGSHKKSVYENKEEIENIFQKEKNIKAENAFERVKGISL